MMLSVLLAQSGTGTPSDLLNSWGPQVGIGGIFIWLYLRVDKRERETQAKYDVLQQKIVDQIVPALKDSALVLESVQSGMASQVTQARSGPKELNATLTQMRRLMAELEKGR